MFFVADDYFDSQDNLASAVVFLKQAYPDIPTQSDDINEILGLLRFNERHSHADGTPANNTLDSLNSSTAITKPTYQLTQPGALSSSEFEADQTRDEAPSEDDETRSKSDARRSRSTDRRSLNRRRRDEVLTSRHDKLESGTHSQHARAPAPSDPSFSRKQRDVDQITSGAVVTGSSDRSREEKKAPLVGGVIFQDDQRLTNDMSQTNEQSAAAAAVAAVETHEKHTSNADPRNTIATSHDQLKTIENQWSGQSSVDTDAMTSSQQHRDSGHTPAEAVASHLRHGNRVRAIDEVKRNLIRGSRSAEHAVAGEAGDLNGEGVTNASIHVAAFRSYEESSSKSEQMHHIAHLLHFCGLVVLAIFLVQSVVRMLCMGVTFFKVKIEVHVNM